MVLYNLYLVLNHETIKIYDNTVGCIVYEGSSETIPDKLMDKLVHDVTIAHEKVSKRTYFLINLN